MSDNRAIQLHLSLKGETVRTYEFDQNAVVVGRNPSADIFVDNPGVSRNHLRIERLPGGEFRVVDLGSANGTFLNDVRVQTADVRNNDVVCFGKYTLKVVLPQDSPVSHAARRESPSGDGATVVLSPAEVRQMMAHARAGDSPAPAAAPAAALAAAPHGGSKQVSPMVVAITLMLVAVVIGIGAFLLTR